jgi:hypothetical protein
MSIFNNFGKKMKTVSAKSEKTKTAFSSNLTTQSRIKESLLSKFPKSFLEGQVREKDSNFSALDKIRGSKIVSFPSLTDAVRDAVGGIRIPSEPRPAPPSTTPPPESPIVAPGTQIEPIFSSSQQTILFLPNLGNSEKLFGGIVLSVLEKPRIVGALENEIISNGVPKECVLFIKRLDTSKYFEQKYTILRRAHFYENEYYQIGSLTGDQISMDKKYAKIAEEYFPSYKNLITFTDANLNAHQSYAYKIRVEYRELTEREKTQRFSPSLSGFADIGRLGPQLFNSEGEE